jgi:hypothetical protein
MPPAHHDNASQSLKPGTYTPGGPPKMRGVLSFDKQVRYHEIPSCHDYEYHDDNTTDESNAVNEYEDPNQASTVAPLSTRMKYSTTPNAYWVPHSSQGSTPVKHWSQNTGIGSTNQPLTIRPELMHQPHFTPNQGDPGGNQGQGGGFNGPPYHTPPLQVPTGGGNGPPFPPHHSGSGGAPPPQGPSSSSSVASSASGPKEAFHLQARHRCIYGIQERGRILYVD